MLPNQFIAFLPELAVMAGALVLFFITLGDGRVRLARQASLVTALLTLAACVLSRHAEATLFDGAYRVNAFSQMLKLVLAAGYFLVVLLKGELPDIRADVKPEYHFFLALHATGLLTLVGSVDVITMIIALELSSFPLYLMVPMRRESPGHRVQMESAIKYIMFGVVANGIMFFGFSYLFGLTGTTSLPRMMTALTESAPGVTPLINTPLAIVGLALAFCGLFYKLAIFPFHFWTPDVYEGASNETTALVASLPKVAAAAVLVRLVSLAPANHQVVPVLLTVLAIASMFYGNLIALVQKDLKRLLAFSGIAHAGYMLVGFTALSPDGHTAALFYIIGYAFTMLACFVVVCQVSTDGGNLAIADLAGLHRRSPLLALTLAVSVFSLAGIPPFVGFMGKFTVLKAALTQGHLALVVVAMINAAIAVFYYLMVVKEVYWSDAGDRPPIPLNWATRLLCVLLLGIIVALGVAPSVILDYLRSSLAGLGIL
jgi:NADH-quinone oxidoreductase subunit N